MGGQGSGRPPSVNTIVQKYQPLTPIGGTARDDIFLPNYSGVQEAALKTSAPLGTGSGGGHIIQDEGVSKTQRSKLNFSGSGVTAYDDAANDATIVSITSGGGAETDPVFIALSGSLPFYAPVANGVTNGDSHDHSGGDGAQIAYSTLSGLPTLAQNEAGASNNFLTAYNSATGAFSKSQPTWANINKATSSIADITTKSHTALSDIGTNTHAQIDTHIADTSDPHGATLTQTTLVLTTLSGSSGVMSSTLSGSKFVVTGDMTLSGSAYVANAVFGVDATPPTASNFPEGTIYFQYTP